MILAEKLQLLRQQHGLSQEGLAEQLGVSRQAVSKWETGVSYPETDKILALCKLYDLSADELLLDRPSTSQETTPARRSFWWVWFLITVALTAAAVFFAIRWTQERANAAELAQQITQQDQEIATLAQHRDTLRAELQQARDVLAAPDENTPTVQTTPDAYALLQTYFCDFAQQWRLDYIPEFSENAAPTESADYLMWAYAVNLEHWSEAEKGTMSKSYVEDRVCAHFAVPSLSHTPLRKTWELNGDHYQAIAAGVNEPPIYGLTAFAVRYEQDVAIYDVTLTRYVLADGSIPTDAQLAQFREELQQSVPDALIRAALERFTFLSGLSGPVFRAHEIELIESP